MFTYKLLVFFNSLNYVVINYYYQVVACFSPGKRKSMADDDKSLTDTDQEKEVKKVKLEDEPADSKDSGWG